MNTLTIRLRNLPTAEGTFIPGFILFENFGSGSKIANFTCSDILPCATEEKATTIAHNAALDHIRKNYPEGTRYSFS